MAILVLQYNSNTDRQPDDKAAGICYSNHMDTQKPSLPLNLHHKLILSHGLVAFFSVLLIGGFYLAAGGMNARPAIIFTLVLAALAGGLLGLAVGAWLTRPVLRRIQSAREISRAWLRGNLTFRLNDLTGDDLGRLAGQLDLLAEQLERDEQDLHELRKRNERLSDQVRALAVVEERNRLARELHDSVKQHLFSLAMTASAIRSRLETLEDGPVDLLEMVSEVETAAQTAQRETTRLIEDLRPGSLLERGLAVALNDYTLLFGAQEHLLIYLDVQGDVTRLPLSVAEAFYRVAQEALHNVARHAQATRVDVQIRCISRKALLTIRDNGVGFDLAQVRKGMGLANMQDRLLAIGGRLLLESQAGCGTIVQAEVDLAQPAEHLAGRSRPELLASGPALTNWGWLGQKLVIPVGQTWPWLPADLEHLRRPVMGPSMEPVSLEPGSGLFGRQKGFVLQYGQATQHRVIVHVRRWGYEWEYAGATWMLRNFGGLNDRLVLMRRRQPLAAMQYVGRQLNIWSEIIYDGRGYRLPYAKGNPAHSCLLDQQGEELLEVTGGHDPALQLRQVLPLPLVIMAAVRVLEESKETFK